MIRRWANNSLDLQVLMMTFQICCAVQNKTRPKKAYQIGLGVLLRMRHEVLGSVDDLNKSIENGKASVQMHATPGCYNMLGTAQLRKFQLFGSMEDLDESIINITKSIHLCENDMEKTHTKFHNLSLALMSKVSRVYSLEDLDKSIEYASKALEESERLGRQQNMPLYASNLGRTLHVRFLVTGSVDDLVAAMENTQKAVDSTPENHAQYNKYRQMLYGIMQSCQTLQASKPIEALESE